MSGSALTGKRVAMLVEDGFEDSELVGPLEALREAGATARTMLVAAAAKRWGVDANSCSAQDGEVIHVSTGRRLKYGGLAAEAAKIPVPGNVALKSPENFKLIGTPAKRLDTPAKVNGTAAYGIDARPPGVTIATLAQSPVFGGRVKSLDDTAARAAKGVRQIVRRARDDTGLRVRRDPGGDLGELCVVDDDGRLGILDEPGALGRRVGRVERHIDQPGARLAR